MNSLDKNVNLFRDFGEMETGDVKPNGHGEKRVAFIHYPDKAKRLAESGKYDFVFYGHTHKPWISVVEARKNQYIFNCTMLNPGNVAGEIYLPTFATWNTKDDKFELIRIHSLN
ncbi:MAG: phosphodiesterase, MJ0936 family protein [Candidatus Moranbacteria bacterium GW2011_GWF2_35_54]|nr:MAG: phosphodiesterase, MJ0936 family protein [Candidatus Moranbacteria bacterium GW2011_GWF2_35_54]